MAMSISLLCKHTVKSFSTNGYGMKKKLLSVTLVQTIGKTEPKKLHGGHSILCLAVAYIVWRDLSKAKAGGSMVLCSTPGPHSDAILMVHVAWWTLPTGAQEAGL